MLEYLIGTTERLVALTLCLGFAFAYLKENSRRQTNYTALAGTVLGVAAAVVMTYFKVYTSLVDTSLWNLRNFIASIIVFLLFIVFSILNKRKIRAGRIGAAIMLGILTVLMILYYLPTVLEMPHSILLTGESIISTYFLVRLIGIIFGLILTFVLGVSVYKNARMLGPGKIPGMLYIMLGINSLRYVGLGVGILLAKRIIGTNHILFMISRYTSNYSSWFLYAMMIAAVLYQISVIIKSIREKEPYSNSAERRKIIAKWRRRRKWAVTTMVCCLCSVLIVTVVKDYSNREVELSPIEETEQDDENMYVTFEQVSDGKLHRFGYTDDDGTVIRFIVIKKPNSSSYGIGLDACDICGETGYYERDGVVVCNLCDVVMNVNTIGFKGGCNPIVIDYSIENGKIIVPIEGLLEHKDEFKS